MKLSITKANSEMLLESRHELEDGLVIHCSISFLLSFSAFPGFYNQWRQKSLRLHWLQVALKHSLTLTHTKAAGARGRAVEDILLEFSVGLCSCLVLLRWSWHWAGPLGDVTGQLQVKVKCHCCSFINPPGPVIKYGRLSIFHFR